MRLILGVIFALLLATTPPRAAPWVISPESQVTVSVKWAGGTARVVFPEILGEIDFDAAHPERVEAEVHVRARSGSTGVALADQLLQSRDYLSSAEYPEISFDLTGLEQTSRSTADIFGNITLRGITRPITFRASVFRYGPSSDDPDRFEAGFDMSGRVDRREFGSTEGAPEIATILPVGIRLLITSK